MKDKGRRKPSIGVATEVSRSVVKDEVDAYADVRLQSLKVDAVVLTNELLETLQTNASKRTLAHRSLEAFDV